MLRSLQTFAVQYGLTDRQVEALRHFDNELCETSTHTNLVARATLAERWSRHYHDSAQLLAYLPDQPYHLLDIGSGAGFPGVVLRILTMDTPGTRYTFCDSVKKKAAFLRRISELSELPRTRVTAERAEEAFNPGSFDVVTARAVTQLSDLIGLARPLLKPGGRLIAPKGKRVQEELDVASKAWSFGVQRHRSETSSEATILVLRDLQEKR